MASSGGAILIPVVTALLGGGLATALSQVLHARNVGRQIEIEQAKAPADIEAVLLGGASQAVAVLTNSLTWQQGELKSLKEEQAADQRRIKELQTSLDIKDRRIHEMEEELRVLRVQLGELQTALDRATIRLQEMRGDSNGQPGS